MACTGLRFVIGATVHACSYHDAIECFWIRDFDHCTTARVTTPEACGRDRPPLGSMEANAYRKQHLVSGLHKSKDVVGEAMSKRKTDFTVLIEKRAAEANRPQGTSAFTVLIERRSVQVAAVGLLVTALAAGAFFAGRDGAGSERRPTALAWPRPRPRSRLALATAAAQAPRRWRSSGRRRQARPQAHGHRRKATRCDAPPTPTRQRPTASPAALVAAAQMPALHASPEVVRKLAARPAQHDREERPAGQALGQAARRSDDGAGGGGRHARHADHRQRFRRP